MIEAADIFASEALEEDDDDVFLVRSTLSIRSNQNRIMDGSEDGFEFCLVLVIAGVVIAVFTDGAEEREGGVQDE